MISSIRLLNFRSHERLQIDLSPLTNVIIGANGSGKTNVLEAIFMLGFGKSFRSSDTTVIRYNQLSAKIAADYLGFERALKIDASSGTSLDKTFSLQGKTYKRLSFHKTAPMVLFEPNFMQLISRGPDTRRDYFDSVIAKTNADYQALLNTYRRALAQRNSLLKQPSVVSDQLFVWDIKLSELAGTIVSKRLQFISELNRRISNIYSEIADKKHTIAIDYLTTTNTKDYTNNLIRGLQKNIVKDRERGFTSLGPHRDDFSFFINHQPAVTSASRGEGRTLLLTLKIIEAAVIEQAREQKPILLLDDVFSELDENRQTKLVEYFKNNQVIITTTTITPLIKGVSGKIIEL